MNRILFRVIIIVYLAIILGFLGKTLFVVLRKPTVSGASAIPALAVEKLDSVSARLEKREKLAEFAPVDVTKFQFGKTEPFRP